MGLPRANNAIGASSYGCNYREGDESTNEKVAAKKALCVLLCAMAKGSYRMMGRILGIDHVLVYRWIREFGESLPEPVASGEITQMEFDEMWHFIASKKRKLWVIKAIDCRTRRTVARILGGRDSTTFRRLYDKVKHLENCTFYTDRWDAFAEVLPPERHIIGNHTIDIEHDNGNIRHHSGRFTRRTRIVSQ